jgi:hypothetical protein
VVYSNAYRQYIQNVREDYSIMKHKLATAILAMGSLSFMLTSASGVIAFAESTDDTTAVADVMNAESLMDQWVYIEEVEVQQGGGFAGGNNGEESEEPTIVQVHPCYALLGVTYCSNPADAEVESMDIYVPAEYMDAIDNGDGTYTCTVNTEAVFERDGVSYTADTAPIIYQNTIDGYRQGDSFNLGDQRKGGPGTFGSYLDSGYIAVSIGARGQDSEVDGTAPAAIVDLKAGVRYLKANDAVLPGDSNKICATGASAGGSMTAVLAASGNSSLYDSYLEEIGAADATDDIYAALVFCPIANLEIGDAAFEYLHAGELSASIGWGENAELVEFDDFHLALHEQLIQTYTEYLEGVGLDSEAFQAEFLDAINTAISYYTDNYVEDKDAFAEENPELTRDGDTFSVADIDTFVSTYMARKKNIPAIDSLDKSSTEAGLFDGEHFSESVYKVLTALSDQYEEAASAAEEYAAELTEERQEEVRLMSALTFLADGEDSTVAPYWRFRNGTKDGDLGSIAAFTMKELLDQQGIDTDYNLIWGMGHCAADYEYEDVQSYVDSICG